MYSTEPTHGISGGFPPEPVDLSGRSSLGLDDMDGLFEVDASPTLLSDPTGAAGSEPCKGLLLVLLSGRPKLPAKSEASSKPIRFGSSG